MYDENDGWFDHVAPPTAPKGTPGEYLTAAPVSRPRTPTQPRVQLTIVDLKGKEINGPLGLGMRVPA